MGSFDDKLKELEPGRRLESLPVDSMIARFGKGIAKAQAEMDANAIDMAVKLGQTELELPHPDDPTLTTSRSLLSLGFLPTFYQFTEATFEMRLDMKWQVEETTKVAVGVNAEVKSPGPVAVAANVSVDDGRRFNLDASLMVNLRLSLVAVPPPQAFLEYVRRSLVE